jgi:3-hydroxy-9,10-secoandrosta-1,3,5(10)-triene-9,17-dione monooxygenase reductase component
MRVWADLDGQKARLVEPYEFAGFDVVASDPAPTAAAWARLDSLLRTETAGYVLGSDVAISVEWLRAAGHSTDPAWLAGFNAMLDYAHTRQWLDDARTFVTAHVVWETARLSDEQRFRHVLGYLCGGLVVVTTMSPDGPAGFTCQSVTAVSMQPPLILVCPRVVSQTWPHVRANGSFAVNILAADQEDVARRFAGSDRSRFQPGAWEGGPSTGAPILSGTLGWAECALEAEHGAGDHILALGRVLELQAGNGDPLVYFRGHYRTVA